MKYKLQCNETDLYGKETGTVKTHEFQTDTLDQMLSQYTEFLRGCGFVFDGEVDLVTEEDWNSDCFAGGGYEDDPTLEDCPEFVINPSYSDLTFTYNSDGGRNLNLSVNEEVTSFTKDVCPVCKLATNTMQNYSCYDKNCGMKP